MSRSRWPGWVHPAIVAAAATATYANSVLNRFALDDNYAIVQNPRTHQLVDQAAIWLTPYWNTFGEHLGLYRPLAIFGYALQWVLGGGEPAVFHAVNVWLHVLVSLLALALLSRLVRPGAALLGALVFAVHPVHTEVVANVVGQAELIAAAAVLAACILHVGRPALRPGPVRTAGIAALFGIGLLAKEGAVVLPGLLVALDFATARVRPERRDIAAWARASFWPYFVLIATLAAYLVLRIHVLGSIGGADAAPNLPFLRHGRRFLSALRAWPEYARLLVFPADLSADYSPAVVLPVESLSPMVALGALLLAGTLGLALATPWLPGAGLPAAWFFIAVFPVSNLVLPIGVLLAERILYLPSFAIAAAAAFAWDRYRPRLRARARHAVSAFATLALAACAGRAIVRNPDWMDTDAVWDALVRDHPESYRAQWVNGWRMLQAGNLELARGYFEISYRIWPDDAILLNNLAGVYIQLGQTDKALPILERSRTLSADLLEQTELLLGYAYLANRRYDESLEATYRADRLRGDRVLVMSLRAQALEGLGRHDQAAATWRYAIRYRRGHIPAFWMMRARALARAGHTDGAIAAADTARSITSVASPLLATIDSLVAAIRQPCWIRADASRHSGAPHTAPPCADPLAAWPIVLPPDAKEVSNSLQNARS